jgi:uncharacterized repeat protein (TIGR04076 family)
MIMKGELLTAKEKEFLGKEMAWAREFEVVKAKPGRKLIRYIPPDDVEMYCSLEGEPKPHLRFYEPVHFIVTVRDAKGGCRANHKIGDTWEFDWCTPVGLCGSAYHTMYPLLHGLMLAGGGYEGPAAERTLLSCPDGGCVTFKIERRRWLPDMWD